MTRDDILPPEGEGRPDADAFGRALGPGIGLNLLVSDVEAAARFQARVLDAVVDYWDRDFAALPAQGAVWMLHSDRSYRDHPLSGVATAAEGRAAPAPSCASTVAIRMSPRRWRALWPMSWAAWFWPDPPTSRTGCARSISSTRRAIAGYRRFQRKIANRAVNLVLGRACQSEGNDSPWGTWGQPGQPNPPPELRGT